MLVLECIKGFSVEERDEPQGNATGKDYIVKKGSLWGMETDLKFDDISDFDELNMIDDKGEYIGDWLSNVDTHIINECFIPKEVSYE